MAQVLRALYMEVEMKVKLSRNKVVATFVMAMVLFVALILQVSATTRSPAHTTSALPNVSLEWVGQVGGPALAVAVQGAYAYVGFGPSLVVLDISDPTHPAAVGQASLLMSECSSMITSVAISGTYAYVTDSCDLHIVSVADPAHPVEVGAYWAGWAMLKSVAVAGDYAYLAGSGVWIINVADPAHPIEVGFDDMPAEGTGVAVAGNYAYVTMMNYLRTYDVTDPAHPVYLYDHSCLISGGADNVIISGTYAYVGTHNTENRSGGLQIINISDPLHPEGVGFLVTPRAVYGVTVAGNYAYLAAGESGLRVVNVSNPAHPTASGYTITADRAQGVAVMGSHAYVVTNGNYGSTGSLRAIRVSDPAHLTEAGAYAPPGSARRVAVAKGYAYVTDESRDLHIISATHLAEPIQVGLLQTAGIARDVVVSGTYAYVADDLLGLRVVNVADPAHPVEVGSYDSPGQAWGVTLADSYAYVADGLSGLRIVRISDPAHPTNVGKYDTPGVAYGVTVVGNYAYIADGEDGGLRIVRISDPAHPAAVGFYDTPGCAQRVAVSGHYAYVADCESLRIVNVADPAHPTEAGVYSFATQDVTLVEDYAYVAGGDVHVLNISDPARPVKVGEYAESARSVAVDESYAYLADYYGLVILRYSLVWPSAAAFSASPLSGPAPLAVTFTDQSAGDYSSNLWDFGDGMTSTLASPTHTYSAVGAYTVTLTINGPGGSDTLTRANYIRVYLPQPVLTAPACGTTNNIRPAIRGLTPVGFVITLYDAGAQLLTATTTVSNSFAMTPSLAAGQHVLLATATNAIGTGLASRPLTLTVNPALTYDPVGVTFAYVAPWGLVTQHLRDSSGCANPDGWRVWLRSTYTTTVTVPVSYTISAAVTVTLDGRAVVLTEGAGQVFAGAVTPPVSSGAISITVTADGRTFESTGLVLIDPDGYVFDKVKWESQGITLALAGITVTCEYSDTTADEWMTWPAWAYDQQSNPQVTGEDGYYSFFVPPGVYRVTTQHLDYWQYTGPDIAVVDAPARLNIPLALVRRVYLPIILR